MRNYTFDDIYFTLLGEVHGENAVPGVPNAYFEGGKCDHLYQEAMEAYDRLRTRLAVEEDADIEIMINNFLSIQRILCEHAYLYGRSCQ